MNTDSLNKPDPMAEDELHKIFNQFSNYIIEDKYGWDEGGFSLEEWDRGVKEAKAAINAYTTNKIIDALEELLLQFRRLPMPESQRDVIVIEFSKALNHRKDK